MIEVLHGLIPGKPSSHGGIGRVCVCVCISLYVHYVCIFMYICISLCLYKLKRKYRQIHE